MNLQKTKKVGQFKNISKSQSKYFKQGNNDNIITSTIVYL